MTPKDTREHLIDVGFQLIHSSGYAATGVKEILAHAGVAKGSFYHYFPSKEAFTEQVLLRYAATELERVQDFYQRNEFRPLDRLKEYFVTLVDTHGQNSPRPGCLLAYLSLEVSDKSSQLQSLLSDVLLRWQKGLASYLIEAVSLGDLPSDAQPDELSHFLLNGWEGALIRMRAEKSNAPLEAFIKVTFEWVLDIHAGKPLR